MKTPDEIEPRTIINAVNTPGDAANLFVVREPGSYYLSANLVGTDGRNGISIHADDVTVDLNGFALLGGGAGSAHAIDLPARRTGLCIHDGTIRGWAGGGVEATAGSLLAERLQLSNNIGAIGLAAGNGSLVRGCVATGNGTGFWLADRTHISDCIATENSGIGIQATSYVMVFDCTASRNTLGGITVDNGCSVIRCSATLHLPDGTGIKAGEGCTVADCTCAGNGFEGIVVGAGSAVRGCTAVGNEGRGIWALNGNCQISGNTCRSNFEGIVIEGSPTGDRNRVEGNSCWANSGIGFLINGFHNVVAGNSASGNGVDFKIPSGNVAGTVLDLRAGGPLTTNSPWVNVIH